MPTTIGVYSFLTALVMYTLPKIERLVESMLGFDTYSALSLLIIIIPAFAAGEVYTTTSGHRPKHMEGWGIALILLIISIVISMISDIVFAGNTPIRDLLLEPNLLIPVLLFWAFNFVLIRVFLALGANHFKFKKN